MEADLSLKSAVCLLYSRSMKRKAIGRLRERRLALHHRRRARQKKLEHFQSEQRLHMVFLLSMLIASRFTAADPMFGVRLWSHAKSDHWWQFVVNGAFTNEDWLRHFRMSHNTFVFLCTQLRPHIEKQTTQLRNSISVEQRVAITLWRLATNVEYRTVAQLFGVGISTVCTIVHEVCQTIRRTMAAAHIKIPHGDAAADVVRGFEAKWGFPQCFGAVDGSHIPVLSPKEFRADYYNRKGFYSMVLQGLVDHRYRFMNVNFGYPGSVHDARVFANSKVYRLGASGNLCPPLQRNIGGVEVPIVILGDNAYPLLQWLLKPFADNGQLTREQRNFNYRLSRARMVVENAFGRLKGRWRILLKRNDTHIRYMGDIVLACCVLHNLCESVGEDFDNELLQNIEQGANGNVAGEEENDVEGATIRDALVRYLAED